MKYEQDEYAVLQAKADQMAREVNLRECREDRREAIVRFVFYAAGFVLFAGAFSAAYHFLLGL